MSDREPVPADTIDALVDGVYPAMALLAGMELDIFSALADGPVSADEVAESRGLAVLQTRLLLDALVAAGLLVKRAGRYELTAESEDHLVASSPWSRVGSHPLIARLWSASLGMAEVVRSGRPGHPDDYSSMAPEESLTVLRSLRADAVRIATASADQLKLEPGLSVADVGGGGGGAASTFAQLVPGVEATVIELPNVVATSRAILDENGATEVAVVGADCTVEVPGSYDRIWSQFVTQTMGPDDTEALITNCAAALRPHGSIHLVNIVVDPIRTTPPRAALFSVPLASLYAGGMAHSSADYERWLASAGLGTITWWAMNDMVQIVSASRA